MANDFNQDIDDNNELMMGGNHLMSGDEGEKEMMRESNVGRDKENDGDDGKLRDYQDDDALSGMMIMGGVDSAQNQI